MNHTIKPPTRAALYGLIQQGNARHAIQLSRPASEIQQAIKEADLDHLSNLALFAISDIGNEENHKEMFIERCKRLGIQ